MTVITESIAGLQAVRTLRDDARLMADRLSDVCDHMGGMDHWTAQDAFTAYRVAEARWQGLHDAVEALENHVRP